MSGKSDNKLVIYATAYKIASWPKIEHNLKIFYVPTIDLEYLIQCLQIANHFKVIPRAILFFCLHAFVEACVCVCTVLDGHKKIIEMRLVWRPRARENHRNRLKIYEIVKKHKWNLQRQRQQQQQQWMRKKTLNAVASCCQIRCTGMVIWEWDTKWNYFAPYPNNDVEYERWRNNPGDFFFTYFIFIFPV